MMNVVHWLHSFICRLLGLAWFGIDSTNSDWLNFLVIDRGEATVVVHITDGI
jgi:hypothetical protein